MTTIGDNFSLEQEYNKALRSIYDALFELNITDNCYKIIYNTKNKYINPPASGNLRETTLELADTLVDPHDREIFLNFFDIDRIRKAFESGQDSLIGELRLLQHQDRDYHWASLTLIKVNHPTNKEFYLCFLMDIEAKKQLEAINNQNTANKLDELTGLYNKNYFYTKAHELIQNSFDIPYIIMRLDFNSFKVINDLFGLYVGDKLLRYIAAIIKRLMGNTENTLACRMESDHFALCFPYSTIELKRIMNTINKDIQNFDLDFELTLSYGLYLVDDISLPVNLMCDRAYLAMQTIKDSYISTYAFYDDTLRQKLLEEQEIVSQMAEALETKQFEIYLQPKFTLTNHTIVGAEALVRWRHPQKGLISPGIFIPIFEKNGFILKLDAFVWEETCKLLQKWQKENKPPMPISVNVSRMNLYNPNLCNTFLNLVEIYNLDKNLLELELTESAYTENPQQLITVTKQLQENGFVLLMDDFGSGYSSLNLLKDIPVNILKIDLRFLADFDSHGRGGNILTSIVRMAKWLQLPTIVEGVETNEQANFLRTIGCSVAQGFLFSRPVPIAEFEALLNSNKSKAVAMLDTYTSAFDMEEFWNPTAPINILFNTIVDAGGIYEFADNKIELIRANDRYYEMLETTPSSLSPQSIDMLRFLPPKDRVVVLEMFQEALAKGSSSRIYQKLKNNKKYLWLQTKLHFLTGDKDRALFYASLHDITGLKNTEKALQTANNTLQDILDKLPIGVGIFELHSPEKIKVKYMNPVALKMSQYTRKEFELANKDHLIMAPLSLPDRQALFAKAKQAQSTGESFAYTYLSHKRDGTTGWTWTKSTVSSKTTEPLLCYTVLHDVSQEEATARNLKVQQERYRILAEHTNILTFDYDVLSDTFHYDLNQPNGINKKDTRHNYLRDIHQDSSIHPHFIEEYAYRMVTAIHAPTEDYLEFQADFSDNPQKNYSWFRAFYVSIADTNGKVYRIVGKLQDIQTEMKALNLIHQQANSDQMTGVYNKVAAQKHIEKELNSLQEAELYSMLMLDLDNFKSINDNFGHLQGDICLRRIADLLKNFYQHAIIGRFGGDEFIIFEKINDETHAVDKLKNFYTSLAQLQAGEAIAVTCSIGLAFNNTLTTDFISLLTEADNAMYTAKLKGKNQFYIKKLK